MTNITYSEFTNFANTLNKFFTNIKEENEVTLEASKDFINKKLIQYKRSGKLRTETFKFKEFAIQEVIDATKLLDKSSYCGITENTVKKIKNSISLIAPILTYIFNCYLNLRIFSCDLFSWEYFHAGPQTMLDIFLFFLNGQYLQHCPFKWWWKIEE